MIGCARTKGAFLWVSWVVAKQSRQPEQGSSHAQCTQNIPAGHRGIRSHVPAFHVDSIPILAVRGNSHPWTTHGDQCPANPATCSSRPSYELSPRLFSPPLVKLAIGSGIGRLDSETLASQRLGAVVRRRHRRRTSREKGLWRGMSPGCCWLIVGVTSGLFWRFS